MEYLTVGALLNVLTGINEDACVHIEQTDIYTADLVIQLSVSRKVHITNIDFASLQENE